MEDKARIRSEARKRMRALAPAERERLSLAVARRIESLREFTQARVLLFYWPLDDEVDVRPLMRTALRTGAQVAIPAVDIPERGEMEAVAVTDLEGLPKGPFGLPRPDPAQHDIIKPEQIQCVIVPGRAFDAQGRRIGRGAGYYDRYLARLLENGGRAPLIGVAFECQMTEEVPANATDVPVDFVVTERRTIRVAERGDGA